MSKQVVHICYHSGLKGYMNVGQYRREEMMDRSRVPKQLDAWVPSKVRRAALLGQIPQAQTATASASSSIRRE
jgi:hypothetical protein